jgi:hypothetical protein
VLAYTNGVAAKESIMGVMVRLQVQSCSHC